MVYINMSFVGMMFWYTTAAPALRPYLPWVSWWMFASIMLALVISLMMLDYKYMLSSRQGFLNRQAYKHKNPLVYDIERMEKNLKKLMKEMGIEYEDN